jgi:serine O-acetyltransferase
LADYVCAQLTLFFPDRRKVARADLAPSVADALSRLERCFLKIRVRRYCLDGEARFDHLYSDQYLMFLWFLSNALWRRKADEHISNKVYLLNKCLHAFDCACDTLLPDIFIVIHGVGTVLGKASYSNYFAVYQGCTVGQTKAIYPRLGRGVGLGAGATIAGDCTIGDFASVGAGCVLINADVEDGSSVFRDDAGKMTHFNGPTAAIAQQYFIGDDMLGA